MRKRDKEVELLIKDIESLNKIHKRIGASSSNIHKSHLNINQIKYIIKYFDREIVTHILTHDDFMTLSIGEISLFIDRFDELISNEELLKIELKEKKELERLKNKYDATH